MRSRIALTFKAKRMTTNKKAPGFIAKLVMEYKPIVINKLQNAILLVWKLNKLFHFDKWI